MEADDRAYLEPPDNEAQPALQCCKCLKDIYEGEEYYEIYGEVFCVDCANSTFRNAV